MISTQPNQDQITNKPSNQKKWFLGSLSSTVVMLAISTWLLTTTTGLQWLLSTVSRASSGSITFSGVNGTVSALHTESIHFSNEDLQLAIHDFKLAWQPKKLFSGQVKIHQLTAREINVLALPGKEPSPPLKMPETLQLPISISVDRLTINVLRIFSKRINVPDTPDISATNISTQLQSNGQHYVLSNFSINSDIGALNVSGQLESKKPFAISGKIKFSGLTSLAEKKLPATHIQAEISGVLNQFIMGITVNGKLIHGDGSITLRPFSPLPVSAVTLSIEGLNPRNISPEAPEANISLITNMRESETHTLTGDIAIKNHHVHTLDHGGLPLREVSANLTLSPDLFQFKDLLLRLPNNGMIAGNLSWQPNQSSGSATLSVSQLNPLALDTRLQAATITGNINLHGDTKIQRGIIALEDGTLTLNANILRTKHAITLEEFQLHRHQSTLTGQGTLYLDNQQLFEFTGKLKKFNLADFIQSPDSELNLSIKCKGNLSPQLAGLAYVNFENSSLAQQPVTGGGTVELNTSEQINGEIKLKIGTNSLLIDGGFGKPGDRMKLRISAPKLAQLGANINGAFNLNAGLAGSFTSPTIRFDITGSNLTLPENHNLHKVTARGYFHNKDLSFNLNLTDYRSQDKTQIQQLTVNVNGQESHHQFKVKAQMDDETAIHLITEGGLTKSLQNKSGAQWRGKLSQLLVTGPLPFNLERDAKLELSQKRFFLDKTNLSVANGKLNITHILWTPKQWHTQGKFTGISLRAGDLPEKNQQVLQLGGEWNVTSAKDLNSIFRIARETGDWVLPGDFPLALGLETLQLTAKITEGKLSGKLAVRGERVGVTNAHISIPLTPSGTNWTILPNAPLTGQLAANINDISWIGKIIDGNLSSGGNFGLQAKLTGTIDTPEFQGKIKGKNLAFALLDQGLRLEQGKLDAHFDHTSLHIDTFKFSAPDKNPPDDQLLANLKLKQNPGHLTISGKIGKLGNETNLIAKLDRVPFAHETNYWVLASGGINTHYDGNILTIKGGISADAGLIAQPPTGRPQLADDIVIDKQSTEESDEIMPNLNVKLDLGKHFYIRASGLAGRLAGQLHLSSTKQNKLNTSGIIATRKANFEAYGQKLSVERGIVNFNGPLDDPGLNILAIRKNLPVGTGHISTDTSFSSESGNLPVEAGVEVLGTVRRPKIRLVSTPTVPDSEKLSWIVFGRPLGSGGVDSSSLLAAAGSILGDQAGGSNITKQFRQTLGIDEISFRQSNSGRNPLSSQIGTIGKRISSRAYVSYERGLTTASIGVTKLSYSLTPKITVVTQAGFDNALDVFYTFQFD